MFIPEKSVQKDIVEFLTANGIYVWPTSSYAKRKKAAAHTKNGISDILGILPDGKLLAIEVKRPYIKGKQSQGELREAQIEFQKQINARNGLAITATSVFDVYEALKDIIKMFDPAIYILNQPYVEKK